MPVTCSGTWPRTQDERTESEVVDLCRDLIRIDTTQLRRRLRTGGAQGGRVRRGAARGGRDRGPGLRVEPGRTSVMATWGGRRATGCCCTATSTSYPPRPSDWRIDPFSGEIEDGYLWGRGAVDMKDFDAMLLAVVGSASARAGCPKRPITLCFTADEEAGGHRGAEVLVNDHPEEFEGVTDGGRGGRRLQHHRPRPPDLPHRGRREGHGLDEAHRPRPRRPRLDGERRQRRGPAGARRSRGWAPTSGRSG